MLWRAAVRRVAGVAVGSSIFASSAKKVGEYQGAYKVTKGFLQKFGLNHVLDIPITEFEGMNNGHKLIHGVVRRKMPHGRFAASFDSPTVDVIVDLGNPILNYTLDGFIKVGGVGVAHAVLQDTFAILKKESVTKHDLNKLVKRAGREGFQAGLVAGVYAGVEYGIERARGKTDWKNAAIGGALTGALLSLSDGTFTRDKIIQHSITGGAIATASEFIRNIT